MDPACRMEAFGVRCYHAQEASTRLLISELLW